MRRRHLESQVTIRRPGDDVWAFVIDLFNSPRVRGMSLATRKVSPGPTGLGSVMDQRVVILGFETRLKFTVIEWGPPHFVVASMSGPFLRSGRVRSELTVTPDGTRKTTTVDLELSTVGVLLWPFLGPFFRRDQERTDRRTKALLEAGPSGTTAG